MGNKSDVKAGCISPRIISDWQAVQSLSINVWWALTLWDPMDCSPPSSSVHEIFQARIPEWVAMSSSRESSPPRDRTWVFWPPGSLERVWLKDLQGFLVPSWRSTALGNFFKSNQTQRLFENPLKKFLKFQLKIFKEMERKPMLESPWLKELQ